MSREQIDPKTGLALHPKKAVPVLLFLFVFSLIIDNGFKLMSPSIADSLDISETTVSLQATLPGILIGIGAVVYAALSDSISIRRLMLFAIVVMSIGSIIGFALQETFAGVLTGRMIQTAGLAAAETLYVIWATKHFEGDEQKKYLGFSTAAFQLSLLLGAVGGGFMATYIGWQAFFLLNLIALLCIPFILKNVPAEETGETSLDIFGLFLDRGLRHRDRDVHAGLQLVVHAACGRGHRRVRLAHLCARRRVDHQGVLRQSALHADARRRVRRLLGATRLPVHVPVHHRRGVRVGVVEGVAAAGARVHRGGARRHLHRQDRAVPQFQAGDRHRHHHDHARPVRARVPRRRLGRHVRDLDDAVRIGVCADVCTAGVDGDPRRSEREVGYRDRLLQPDDQHRGADRNRLCGKAAGTQTVTDRVCRDRARTRRATDR